jgi:predicted alpha/beta hydrolase
MGDDGMSSDSAERQIDAQGHRLAASVFEQPDSDTAVLVNAATGVPRQFYKYFATYLRDHGWTAVTWDYRGIGGSAPRTLRGFDVRMRDWALVDMPTVIDWLLAEFRPQRIFCVGHSFGGQGIGLIERPERITAMIGVSAQSGYWGVQGGVEKHRARFAVTVLIPVLTRLFGYFPWSRFAAGEDLPRGVALEWARWCRDRDYLLGDDSLPLDRYHGFIAPILAYSIDDDDWGTPRAVDEMMRAYSDVTRRHLVPADYGLEKLGHMGFFRRGSEPIWDEAIAWLEGASSPA